ncbi:unnamed protein product, partial [Ranitomeya imitator]
MFVNSELSGFPMCSQAVEFGKYAGAPIRESAGDVLYELLQCIKNHRQGLVKQSFFSQCERKNPHLQRQICISTNPLPPAPTQNNGQDVPLNLCQRTQGHKPGKGSAEDIDYLDGKIKGAEV